MISKVLDKQWLNLDDLVVLCTNIVYFFLIYPLKIRNSCLKNCLLIYFFYIICAQYLCFSINIKSNVRANVSKLSSTFSYFSFFNRRRNIICLNCMVPSMYKVLSFLNVDVMMCEVNEQKKLVAPIRVALGRLHDNAYR